MLADGLYEKFPKPDSCLALHADPRPAAGQVTYTEGLAFANVDTVDILVKGKGGHGAARTPPSIPSSSPPASCWICRPLSAGNTIRSIRSSSPSADPRRHQAQHHPQRGEAAAHGAHHQGRGPQGRAGGNRPASQGGGHGGTGAGAGRHGQCRPVHAGLDRERIGPDAANGGPVPRRRPAPTMSMKCHRCWAARIQPYARPGATRSRSSCISWARCHQSASPRPPRAVDRCRRRIPMSTIRSGAHIRTGVLTLTLATLNELRQGNLRRLRLRRSPAVG